MFFGDLSFCFGCFVNVEGESLMENINVVGYSLIYVIGFVLNVGGFWFISNL